MDSGIALDQLGAAWSSAYAGWAGALANLLVVIVTLALATRETRISRANRQRAEARALKRLSSSLEAIEAGIGDALLLYPIDREHPDEVDRAGLSQRVSAAYSVMARVQAEHLSEENQEVFDSIIDVVADTHSAISSAGHALGMTAGEQRRYHAKLTNWRGKLENARTSLG